MTGRFEDTSFAKNTPWLGKFDKNMKSLIRQANRIQQADTVGEWTGQIRNSERCHSNDSVIALALFVAGTITEGCQCDSCDHRRHLVNQLVFGVGIDDKLLEQTIFNSPLPSKPKRSPRGTRQIRKSPEWMRKSKPPKGKV